MLARSAIAPKAKADFTACSGCSLCLLVCPVWRKTHDLTLTPHGRAKALQHGAGIADITPSIESCTLCGACEPVCPEEIDLVGMIVDLRRRLPSSGALQPQRVEANVHLPSICAISNKVFLPGTALRGQTETLARIIALLNNTAAEDDGADIALALETGAVIPAQRLEQFLAPLRAVKSIVAADGLLARHLRNWLPRANIESLGAALSSLPPVRRGLRATDFYVIEPRAYHADHARLVRHYDCLRFETGCAMNLDLQRIAIPATARNLRQRLGLEAADDQSQTQWLLHRRKIQRIVVENVEDIPAFKLVCEWPVVQLAELAEDGKKVSIQPQ